LSVTLFGCSSAPQPAVVDKAGSQALVLHLWTQDKATAQEQPPGPRAFLDSLGSVSGGRIQYDLNPYDGGGGYETKLVQAIASGQIDGGFPAVRAFGYAGITGLEAAEAPLTLNSYAAETDLVSGSVANDLLAQLEGTGVVGLGLAAGPLRRAFAGTAPLLGPGDWQGSTFRTFNSPIQDATITALGGLPSDRGPDWTQEIPSGELRGVEFDIPQYAARELTTEAPFVTANVVLWPKIFVFSLSQKRWDGLTDQQRSWIQQAANAGTRASVDAIYDETTPARSLCDVGVRFVDASPSQLADLHAAVAPVIKQLADDRVNGPLLSEIEAIAARHPETDVPDVPAPCQTASPQPTPSIPPDVSKLPPGTYRVQITLADLAQAGVNNGNGLTGTWTLTVYTDGTYMVSCEAVADTAVDCGNEPANTPIPVEAGYVRGDGATVYFVPDCPLEAKVQGRKLPPASVEPYCFFQPPYWLDWSLDGSTLTFTNRGGLPRSKDSSSIKPWTKIG
jgi:TRAP-type C4-dicarboxylate transport system substrate-binding protein